MPNIPIFNINGTDYKLKDTDLRNNIVLAQNTQPTNENNRIWLQENSEERQVPTWEEFSDLKSALNEKSSSILPSSPTGHGLYSADGTYGEDAGWNSYYIPIAPEAKCTIVFNGTTSPYNNLNEYASDGTFIKTHGRTKSMSFISSANTAYIGCAILKREAGSLDVLQLNVRGEIDQVQNNLDQLSSHVDENGLMTRYAFTDAKTYKPLFGIESGETFYFRAVSSTNSGILGLTLYGMNTNEDPVMLVSMLFGGEIQRVTTDRAYEFLQVSLYPYPAGNFSGTIDFDILKSNSEGVIQDIYKLQSGAVSRNLNTHITRIFQKVICVGDSYTEGYIWLDGDSGRTIEPMYAWPHFMELETGNKWINCGVSGANVFTWQESENGYQKAVSSGRAQAYVIGLLINDRSDSDRGVPLGTIADIGTDAHTYYAGMSQIIRRLNALNPLAKIFVNTCPAAPVNSGYNIAIRDIVNAYKNTYPVYCIDLAADGLFTQDNPTFSGDAMGGHYTGIGYEQMAEVYNYTLSKYIGKHISEFQNVHKIPFDA